MRVMLDNSRNLKTSVECLDLLDRAHSVVCITPLYLSCIVHGENPFYCHGKAPYHAILGPLLPYNGNRELISNLPF